MSTERFTSNLSDYLRQMAGVAQWTREMNKKLAAQGYVYDPASDTWVKVVGGP